MEVRLMEGFWIVGFGIGNLVTMMLRKMHHNSSELPAFAEL